MRGLARKGFRWPSGARYTQPLAVGPDLSVLGKSMRFWLTTHYKHQSKSHPYSIYLKDEYKQRAEQIDVGDQVVFYEIKGKSGGRQAVVAIAEVRGGIRENVHRDGGPDIGEEIWEWEIPCIDPDLDGMLSKQCLNEIMQWKPNWSLRVPGGLMELDEKQFKSIATGFKKRS